MFTKCKHNPLSSEHPCSGRNFCRPNVHWTMGGYCITYTNIITRYIWYALYCPVALILTILSIVGMFRHLFLDLLDWDKFWDILSNLCDRLSPFFVMTQILRKQTCQFSMVMSGSFHKCHGYSHEPQPVRETPKCVNCAPPPIWPERNRGQPNRRGVIPGGICQYHCPVCPAHPWG